MAVLRTSITVVVPLVRALNRQVKRILDILILFSNNNTTILLREEGEKINKSVRLCTGEYMC